MQSNAVVAVSQPDVAAAQGLVDVRRSRGRPTTQQSAQLRETILHTALSAFMARGFEAASMEGIAHDAGVAKVTLYRQFVSKEQLFVAAVRAAQVGIRDSLKTIGVDRQAPLEQVLRELIEKLYEAYTQPHYLAVMRMVVAESRRFPRLARAMLVNARYATEPLEQYLQQLKAARQIEIGSVDEATAQLAGLASGAGRYLLVTPSGHPMSKQHWVDSLVALFTKAWRVQGEPNRP